ncbi:methylmalonyl-CoA epimerase [Ignavibacteria bacterium]|nr:methylmalonyl-CoA epimerase [Bacteroidota bacterium]
MIRNINHIGIATHNLETAMNLYGKIFGITEFHRERVEAQKVDIASFRIGNVLIELTAPTSPDSPIGKFLDKRGEGIHHIAFSTDNVDVELARLENEGIALINHSAQAGAHDMLIGFLHPKSTGGVLMELCQNR